MTARCGDAQPTDLIQSVSRALRIIEQVAASPCPLPVKVIARRSELKLATTYHLIRTLCYEGYLIRHPGGGYVVGTKLAERFHEVIGSFGRPPHSKAVIRHLADVTGHTAYLASISAGRLLIVDLAEGGHSPWLEDLQSGLEIAAHATALGKALLGTLPCRARQRLLTGGMRPFTPRTRTEPTQVEAEIADLGPGAMVTEYGEFREQVCCASVAVQGSEGDGWWALGTSARGLALPGFLLAELRLAAADLTAERLPGPDPGPKCLAD